MKLVKVIPPDYVKVFDRINVNEAVGDPPAGSSSDYIKGWDAAKKAFLAQQNNSSDSSSSQVSSLRPLQTPDTENSDSNDLETDAEDEKDAQIGDYDEEDLEDAKAARAQDSADDAEDESDDGDDSDSSAESDSDSDDSDEDSTSSKDSSKPSSKNKQHDSEDSSEHADTNQRSVGHDTDITADELLKNAQVVRDQERRQAEKQRQEVQRNEKELLDWQRDPIKQFKRSVADFFADEEDDDRDNDYAIPGSRRDLGDDSIPSPGRRKVYNAGLPEVNIYFDQANSGDLHQTDVGEQVLSTLRPYQEKGLLKTNLYYFAKNVHTEDRRTMGRNPGYAWPDGDRGSTVNPDAIIDHIKQTGVQNVIVITDHNLSDVHSSVRLAGAVWMFFYQGVESTKFRNAIKGRAGHAWVIR